MKSLFCFPAIFGVIAASVDFSYSTLYDIYDFKGHDVVHLPKCNYGCFIYASTMGEFANTKDGLDPYAKNLIIEDAKGNNVNFTDVAQWYDDATGQKKPLEVMGPQAQVWVSNLNEANASAFSIVLYVIDRSKAHEFSYAVYDALNMRNIRINPNGIVTIMSAMQGFTVKADKNGVPNSVTARLTGFENALDTNPDNCPVAYTSPKSDTFPGFSLQMTVPIVSFSFGQRNTATFTATLNFIETQDLKMDGFISSAGYNGCRKPLNGGVQSFRSPLYQYSDMYLLSTNDNDYNVTLRVRADNLDDTHKLMLRDVTNNFPVYVTTSSSPTVTFQRTRYVEVQFPELRDKQGFVVQRSAVPTITPGASTTSTTVSSSSPPTSTEGVPLPTTSSSWLVTVGSWTLLLSLAILIV